MSATPKSKMTFTTPIPEELLPDCWSKEERMKSLFAPFRNRSANPEDWNSKYKFWNQFINDWAAYHYRCSFSLADLNINFKRNGCTALCLPTVLMELYNNGEVVPESEFLREPSKTWTGWTVDLFVKKPISWSFSKLKSYVAEPTIELDTKYIHLPTVKSLANVILSSLDSKQENILLTLSEITQKCKEKTGSDRITESNVRLALIWLRNTKKAAFRECKEDSHNLLVKISSKGAEEVSEVDEGTYKLTQQEMLLIKNIEQLETERNEAITKAKSAVASGLKQVAKSFLRKKHELDKCIERRSAALLNVQKLLSRIHDAHYDSDTLEAYKAGYSVLKKFEDVGLTEQEAANTMDDMAEILDELKEVQTVMAQPVALNESDAELEQELADIMGTAWEDLPKSGKTKDKSFNSVELPDLSALDLQDLPAPKSKNSVQPSQES
ncbi:charged multivesicular body protein 7 [Trichogramma pretiosum]|uniref:charged multivesicular body protein 7 n=1 Tax=Trichogramma pretiosum TaxID=7493 RepID=UPI0006C9BB13|nr:charged multivesicular body protein 7 [Trichogramma pretiosum]XP_023317258.1 charged multivesicular body protein 7 [Trichogramma pretiosum]XP_023317259.1 charged multivesicular body protein 7 [Trichogramma pretiosum]XP_023317260.1 charged multivesicular body protein 7 [Trichogramma pretiosum]